MAAKNDDDCRDGYSCEPHTEFPDRRTCRPACTDNSQCSGGRVCNPAVGSCDVPFDPDEYGQSCSTTRGACAGGTCLTEFESGFPGSYCIYQGCFPTMDDASDGCPGNGVCVEDEDATFCLQGCSNEDDCRSGYECRPVDEENPDRGQGCFPACEQDRDCANDGSGGSPDFICNQGTGLCTYSFVEARLGAACTNIEDDCRGGRCLLESEEGFPGGTCVAIGCSLNDDVPGQACPEAGICVDDEQGDPSIGFCLSRCTTETSGVCREGYACESIGEGSEGACRPACTEDSCSEGRTCNETTSLCEA